MLDELSNNIKKEVIDLYMLNDIDFDVDKYYRIIDMVVHAMMEDNDINMIYKLKIYYAVLLYPTNNLSFYSYNYENARTILEKVNISLYIIDDVIKEIDSNIAGKNGLIYDALQIDSTNPPSLLKYAGFLLDNDIPLYTPYTPYIKSPAKIKTFCHPLKEQSIKKYSVKNYKSFMEYIYYVGLFLPKDNITNKYYIKLINANREKMKELCLLFGEKESIELKDIKEWSSK